jgi:hypothetical protein
VFGLAGATNQPGLLTSFPKVQILGAPTSRPNLRYLR